MASVSKRKDSGKWEVRHKTRAGKQTSKSFRLKKDADIYRREVEEKAANGKFIPDSEALTVRQVCYNYMLDAEDRLAAGQIGQSRYQRMARELRVHVERPLGDRRMKDLTALDYEDWIKERRRSGNQRIKGGRLSTASIRHLVSMMKLVEEFAFRRGYIFDRLVAEARRHVGRMDHAAVKTFNVDQVQVLLQAACRRQRRRSDKDTLSLSCYLFVAAFCGLRVGEINGLKPEHLDFDRRVIRVRHNLTRFGELKGPKTKAGVRDVPMPQVVSDLLSEWMRLHYTENRLGTVFSTRNGEPYNHIDVWQRWRRLLAAEGLGGQGFHFHALRHFAASTYIEHGVPLPDVARILGHETFDMTLQVYAHPVRDVSVHQAAVERIAAAIPVAPVALAHLSAVTVSA